MFVKRDGEIFSEGPESFPLILENVKLLCYDKKSFRFKRRRGAEGETAMKKMIMKKTGSMLLALVLLLALVPSAYASGFSDVKSSDWYYGAVAWAVENGITSGTSATAFSPNDTCSNAQILTFLWRAAGQPAPTAPNPFGNVSAGSYYYQPALWAHEKGLIEGGSFDAKTDCTRAMAVTYIWKAKGMPFSSTPASFSDVPVTDYELSIPVAWAVENNITAGTGSNMFSPNKVCTRAEIAAFLLRAYGGGKTGAQTQNDQCAELIRLINAERVKAGLKELDTMSSLAQAAQLRSDDLSKGYFDNRPDGSEWTSVIPGAGISADYVDESVIGGSSRASDMFVVLTNTPEAYAAMLNGSHTHVAAGYTYTDSGYGGYQDFWSVLYIAAAGSAPSAPSVPSVPAGFTPVPMKDLDSLKSLQKKCTDAEFTQAYNKAVEMVAPYAGMSLEDQLYSIASSIRELFDQGMSYSMETEHYNDPYGYFVLGSASCAGCTRATGLCLNILGIPYEHVNENQYSHQWCRVKVGDTYWICDAFGLYCGPEPAPYTHPYL